jgi:hypothetical protein
MEQQSRNWLYNQGVLGYTSAMPWGPDAYTTTAPVVPVVVEEHASQEKTT